MVAAFHVAAPQMGPQFEMHFDLFNGRLELLSRDHVAISLICDDRDSVFPVGRGQELHHCRDVVGGPQAPPTTWLIYRLAH